MLWCSVRRFTSTLCSGRNSASTALHKLQHVACASLMACSARCPMPLQGQQLSPGVTSCLNLPTNMHGMHILRCITPLCAGPCLELAASIWPFKSLCEKSAPSSMTVPFRKPAWASGSLLAAASSRHRSTQPQQQQQRTPFSTHYS
jgi:hypothetical protein